MPGPIPKPTALWLRAPVYKRAMAYTFVFSLPASIAIGFSYFYFYAVKRTRNYVEFYKNYDPYEHGKEICNYPIQYFRSCPEVIKRDTTLALRDEGYTPEQIAEHFAKRAAAPTYEDVLDEVPDDQVGPPRKFRPPLKPFFLGWFVPFYKDKSQIPDDFKA